MNPTKMMTSKRWAVAVPAESAVGLAERLRTSALVAQILLNRGVSDPSDCSNFLQPNLKALLDPALIPGLSKACERIAKAIKDQQQIVVYGDYDVDGITAVAILWHAIKILGGKVRYYIPHRIEEGYGLNVDAVKQVCDEGAELIITVDCGVTAVEPARVAKERNVDLIITDHHEWREKVGENQQHIPELPDCYAVVHPRLPGVGEKYPNDNLCGSGVAFKVAWGIGQVLAGASKVPEALRGFLIEALALAGLGTIADVVPLVGENRIIAHFGLGSLKQSKLTGIRALITSAKLDDKSIDSYHAGFLLAPRLNASGRMGHAKLAVEMLTDATEERAIEIATFLEQQNRLRQNTERDIVQQAMAQVEELQLFNHSAIVVGGQGWHPGVIGIVASRLVDKFYRPTIVVALSETIGQGSGRSVDGFHLSKALESVTHTLESHGGHEMAAGLKVKPENFETFRKAFVDHVEATIDPTVLIPELRLDCDAGLQQITKELVNDLKRLGPFGRGNPKPLLRCQNVTLSAAPRKVGKAGDHLQLFLKQNGCVMKAIAFDGAKYFDQLKNGSTVHLAVEPQISEYNGKISVELAVKDLKITQ